MPVLVVNFGRLTPGIHRTFQLVVRLCQHVLPSYHYKLDILMMPNVRVADSKHKYQVLTPGGSMIIKPIAYIMVKTLQANQLIEAKKQELAAARVWRQQHEEYEVNCSSGQQPQHTTDCH